MKSDEGMPMSKDEVNGDDMENRFYYVEKEMIEINATKTRRRLSHHADIQYEQALKSPTRGEEGIKEISSVSPRPITSLEEKYEEFDKTVLLEGATNSENPSNRIFVQFKDITIHEHNLIIGDNPACSSGCPIRYVIHSTCYYDDHRV